MIATRIDNKTAPILYVDWPHPAKNTAHIYTERGVCFVTVGPTRNPLALEPNEPATIETEPFYIYLSVTSKDIESKSIYTGTIAVHSLYRSHMQLLQLTVNTISQRLRFRVIHIAV